MILKKIMLGLFVLAGIFIVLPMIGIMDEMLGRIIAGIFLTFGFFVAAKNYHDPEKKGVTLIVILCGVLVLVSTIIQIIAIGYIITR